MIIAPLQKGVNAQPSNVLPGKGIPIMLECDKTLSNIGTCTSVKTIQKSSSDVNDTTVNSKAVEDGGELRYISKYLVQFVPDTRSQKKEQTAHISGAGVLTGDKCAEILKEREEKKQKEKEEKEKRKLLREQKKKEKEEELKKKKAAAEEKKAAVAEKKAAAAEKKAAAAEKKDVTENVETLAESEETRKRPMNSYTLRAKQTRYDVVDSDAPSCSSVTTSDNISTSTTTWQCSICYEDYDEVGTEDWVQCGCGRWTHELCIIGIVIDATGKELFCPYCSV